MKKNIRQFFQTGLILLSIFFLITSCATVDKMSSSQDDNKSNFFEHVVKWPEENLYNITIWRTGSLDKYNEIRTLNLNLLPYGLSPGDKVLIPQAFVSNREAMPKISEKSKQKKLPVQPLGRTYHMHRVTISGESLSIIAKWYTGDLKKWEQLAEANPNLNPNRIDIGDEILIPEDMMIRKDPITKRFVDSFAPKPRKKKVVAKPAPEPVTPPPPEPTEEENGLELVPPKF